MSQQELGLPGPRISRITLARLHNLGNYEHVRYEVTVELPPGTSPASVVRELEDTLNALQPRSPVDGYALREAIKLLSTSEPTLRPKDPHDPFDDPKADLARALEQRARAGRDIERHQEWTKAREAALQRFDALGGTSRYTDAKDDWEPET